MSLAHIVSVNNKMAYKRGYLEASNGKKKVGDNPYPDTKETHWQWLNGFTQYRIEAAE